MNELIKIDKGKIGAQESQTVDARALYGFLEVSTVFPDWISRLFQVF